MSASLRAGIFAAACVAQLLLVGGAIAEHERALADGEPYRFAVAPVDPVDPFRGRYVALAFDVGRSRVPAPSGDGIEPPALVYAVLENDEDGFARVRALRVSRPSEGDFLKVRYNGSYEGVAHLGLPFDRYYAAEDEAARIERDFAARAPGDDRSYALVRVRSGHGVIESLHVGGTSHGGR